MRPKILPLFSAFTATMFSIATLTTSVAEACTRFVYLGENDQVMTARSMDWKTDVGTNIWVFPAAWTVPVRPVRTP